MKTAEVRLRARVRLTFEDVRTARAVLRATSADNPVGLIDQRIRGRALELEVAQGSPRSVRESLDDWLRCAAAAAETARRAR